MSKEQNFLTLSEGEISHLNQMAKQLQDQAVKIGVLQDKLSKQDKELKVQVQKNCDLQRDYYHVLDLLTKRGSDRAQGAADELHSQWIHSPLPGIANPQ